MSVESLLTAGVYYTRLPDNAYVSAKVLKQYIAALREAVQVRHTPSETLEAHREGCARLDTVSL